VGAFSAASLNVARRSSLNYPTEPSTRIFVIAGIGAFDLETIENALYLVATPIGNLADISYRAVHILQNVDRIAAEDTRTTANLLRHYQINTPMGSYHSYNIKSETPHLVEKLKNGSSIALVSDAGTPAISDPGYLLVRACTEQGVRVIPIPGASALLAALTACGLPTKRFVFEGFLPLKKGRKSRMEALIDEERTIVIYESPHRISKTVSQMADILGNRPCVLVRELTKVYEDFIPSTLPDLFDLLQEKKPRGEMVLVIEGAQRITKHKQKYKKAEEK